MYTSITESFSTVPPAAPVSSKARIIARNTFQYATEDGREVIRLHYTDIVERLPKARLRLNSGGFRTVTTKDRINTALSGTEYRLNQSKGVWTIQRNGESVPFYDGMTLPEAFDSPAARKKAERKAEKVRKLKAKIKAFVDSTLPDGKPLPLPCSGDCWICMLFPGSHDSSHLAEHIREGYMHGSLIVLAAKSAGWTDDRIRLEFSYPSMKSTRKLVRSFLETQLAE
jgi:hypothetical protein